LAGRPEAVFPGYRWLDLWRNEFRGLRARRDPACPACGRRDFPWLEGRRGVGAAEAVCGGGAVRVPAGERAPDLPALAERLAGTVADLELRSRLLRYRAGGLEVLLFADGHALVRGTEDPARARSILARTAGA
ncbi:MAG: thiazole biosynthesis adenylyltransferase ThiF, partial [Planctomycetota bacterium]